MLHNRESLARVGGWGWLRLAVIAAVLAAAVAPAAAQLFLRTATHPGGLMVVRFEEPGIYAWWDTSDPPERHYWQRPAGRFQLLTGPMPPTGGDPTFEGDENRAVASATSVATGPDDRPYLEFSSKLTVAVGGDHTTGNYHDLHILGANAADVSGTDPVWDLWPIGAGVGSRDIYAMGHIPLDDEDPNVATEFVEVEHRFTLILDTLQIEYIVTNRTTGPLPIGIRQVIDGRFGTNIDTDGRAVYLPNGRVVNAEKVIPDATDRVIPDTWVTLDRPDNPTVYLRGTLAGTEVEDPGMANESAGPPDEIGWGLMRNCGRDLQWDFNPSSLLSLEGEDWAYYVKWDERDLAAGRSRRYVTYFGMGSSSADYDPRYALAGYAPAILEVKAGDDPGTPAIETYYLTDRDGRSPFPVYAYADNFYPSSLIDASVRISLPTGLELDPPTQPHSKSLGTLKHNDVSYVAWTIRATSVRPGTPVIRFTGPLGKTVERKINIPAIPVLSPLPSLLGLEMLAIPYTFADTDAEHVFASLGSLHVGGPNALIRYNPDDWTYRWFPDPFITNITPGNGFWLLNRNRLAVTLPNDALPLPTDEGYSLNVPRGWNQIGNPFTAPSPFHEVHVIDPSGDEWEMDEAVARGLLLPALFWYKSETNEYDWETELTDVRLDPYMGYWLYCSENITLQFPPPNPFAPASAPKPTDPVATTDDGGWKVPLTIAGGGRVRSERCFGVAEEATDGVDRCDVLAPPRCLPDGVVLTAELAQPGTGMRFMEDIRKPTAGAQEWSLIIDTNASAEPITITWPDLAAMPADLTATIEDTATGERRYMRTTRSVVYTSSVDGGERAFTIRVQPRAGRRTLVTAASVKASGRGASIVYSLAADASVDIEIRNIAGFPIRKLTQGKLSSAGVNTELWDGRTGRGVSAPPGRYLCTVTARSPETGEQHSMVNTFQLAR